MLDQPRVTVWTIGHSTRSWEGFLDLLRESRIEQLSDVRHFPSSRRVPWADRATLATALPAEGIRYELFVDLGGFRKPRPDSANLGWRNMGFRGYADYMDTDAFRTALDRLLTGSSNLLTAIMCSEAVPWRCNRTLLADALLARGARVIHILAAGKVQEHRLTPFARIHAGRLRYPGKG